MIPLIVHHYIEGTEIVNEETEILEVEEIIEIQDEVEVIE